jgi:hypothetical protein
LARTLSCPLTTTHEGSYGRTVAVFRLGHAMASQQIAALASAINGQVLGGPEPVRLAPRGSVILGQKRELLANAETSTRQGFVEPCSMVVFYSSTLAIRQPGVPDQITVRQFPLSRAVTPRT